MFIVPASLSCSLPFVPGWLPCSERASHSALRVCCRIVFVVFYVFSFPPGVYVGTLNLIASIRGPLFLLYLGPQTHNNVHLEAVFNFYVTFINPTP